MEPWVNVVELHAEYARKRIAWMHPVCVEKFLGFQDHLIDAFNRERTGTLFLCYEAYRSPQRQHELTLKRPVVTKAKPWRSLHQYGLAADFVPWVRHENGNGTWSWDEDHDYAFLKAEAPQFNLWVPIPWDRCHVEYEDTKEIGEYV